VERTAILVLGHGSRRPRANQEFELLVSRFRARRPDLDVGHAYIELASPSLQEGLSQLAARADRVVVLPLFLFAAGHVKHDVPRALAEARAEARAAFPGVRFEAARSLGVHRAMVDLALYRARGALPSAGAPAAETVLLGVGRGASDPDANGDFCKLVRLIGEAGGFAAAESSFIAITRPRFPEAAERVALSHPRRILVLPYFLFEGLLVEQLAGEVREFSARHPEIDVRLAKHLGVEDALVELLGQRLGELLHGGEALPCDTCPRPALAC
jgi:sirohydrochlorin cobaltochelatase